MNRNLVIGGAAGVAVATGIGIAIAVGGGSSGASGYGGGAPASSGTGTTATTVQTARTDLGQTLVDARGRTLYLFEADRPGTSACSNACASVWPPLTTSGAPHAGGGAQAAQLGTLQRADGSRQVTYDGHPLYLYVGDTKSGAVNGQGLDQFGAEWYALAPSGDKIDNG